MEKSLIHILILYIHNLNEYINIDFFSNTIFHRLANFPIFIPRLQLDTLYARATNRINSIFVTRRAIIEAFDRGFELNPKPAAKNRAIFSADCRFNQQLPR